MHQDVQGHKHSARTRTHGLTQYTRVTHAHKPPYQQVLHQHLVAVRHLAHKPARGAAALRSGSRCFKHHPGQQRLRRGPRRRGRRHAVGRHCVGPHPQEAGELLGREGGGARAPAGACSRLRRRARRLRDALAGARAVKAPAVVGAAQLAACLDATLFQGASDRREGGGNGGVLGSRWGLRAGAWRAGLDASSLPGPFLTMPPHHRNHTSARTRCTRTAS